MEKLWRFFVPAVHHHFRCYFQPTIRHPRFGVFHLRTLYNLNLRHQSTSEAIVDCSDSLLSITDRLRSAQNVADVLAIVEAEPVDLHSSAAALLSLNKLITPQIDQSDFRSSRQVKKVLNSLKNPEGLRSDLLVGTLNSLFNLKLDMYDTVKPLEIECRHRLRTMPIRSLVQIVVNAPKLRKYRFTDDLVKESFRLLELRWKEINNPQSLKILLTKVLDHSPSFAEKLEDKTLSLLENYSPGELALILRGFANVNRRSLIILRTISTQLAEQRGCWEVKPILDIMGSMGRLGYSNLHLFTEFAAFLQGFVDECSPSQVANIALTFGLHLQYDHDLFTVILAYTQERLEQFSMKDLEKLFLAISQFNLLPPGRLLTHMQDNFQKLDFTGKVNVALYLAALNALPVKHLKSILGSSEVKSTFEGRYSFPKIKLMQLNTLARHIYADYNGPFLTEELLIKSAKEINTGVNTTILQKSLIEVCTDVLGSKSYVQARVTLTEGYFIDAVLVLDGKGNPLSHEEYCVEGKKLAGDSRQPIPQDASKVAVISMGYKFYLAQSEVLQGRIQLMLRLLRSAGWKVIQIPHKEWLSLSSSAKKEAYLLKNLQDGVGPITISKSSS